MAGESPLVSIIIPTYNSSTTLEKCLDSITVQNFKNFELVIVDGLSTDNTIAIVKDYCNAYKNIRWICGKDNGTYDAMNKGIKLAIGQWLYFIGSDDSLFDSTTLETITSVLQSCKEKVVFGNVLIQGNTSWAADGDIYDRDFTLSKLLQQNICHQAIFYNAGFIKKNAFLFNIRYRVMADWDFNIRCWAKTKFLYVDLIIAKFKAGGSSTGSEIQDDFNKEFIENYLRYFKIDPYNKLTQYLPAYRMPQLEIVRSKEKFFDKVRSKIKSIFNT